MTMEPPGDDGSFMTAGEGVVPGSRIAGYRVTGRIGRGGMAVVFQAQDERLGRLVALKVLTPALAEDEAFRQRFIRESRAAAAVDDPHIIPVFEAGDADGVLFIAMRYVAGGDVRSLIRRAGPLPVLRAVSIMSPVAAALDAAHAAGLVHRDVKPANMLIDTRPGRPDHVYLSDFGLSKGALSSVGLTGSGLFLGTPDYVSPEQIDGRLVDGRADQYALACAAFEMLSGEPPFARDHGMAVIYAHASQPPPALTERRPGLPAAVDAVLTRALAKDPAGRYGSCQEFGESLREALGAGPYAIEVAADEAERPATVVVLKAIAGLATDACTSSSGSEGASGAAAGMRDDEAEIASDSLDYEETITHAPLGAGDPARPEGMIAPKPDGTPGPPVPHRPVGEDNRVAQLPKTSADLTAPASGPTPRRRRSRSLLVLGAAGVLLAGAALGTVAALNNSSANRAHEPPGRTAATGVVNSSPTTGTHQRPGRKANALVPMTPIPSGQFYSVIAGPGRSAWAIGDVGSGSSSQPLIEHWNGTAWSPASIPSIPGAFIHQATAGPGGTAWAVGSNGTGTLVLHWDGTAWSIVPSPSPGGNAFLESVAAESNGTAWAEGGCGCGGVNNTLLLHWNGTAWTQVSADSWYNASALAAGADGVAWAVGNQIFRWNGTAWTQVPNAWVTVSGNTFLNGVSTGPGGTTWAVGSDCNPCSGVPSTERDQTVVLHWDGAQWSQVPSPNPAGNANLNSVSTGPGGTAWAVGYYCAPRCIKSNVTYETVPLLGHTLILRWNGTAWVRVPSPSPGHADALFAVAAGDDGSAWAAGMTCTSYCGTSAATYQTLILRWNGTAWVPG
jgi:hypothetical protein